MNAKLRDLLSRVRVFTGPPCGNNNCAHWGCKLSRDVATVLEEPVAGWQPHEPVGRTEYVVQIERERDEARAEVERLRNALAAISLDEYESTSSAADKVHGHARIARKALYGEKP